MVESPLPPSNSPSDSVVATRRDEMAAFDRLPETLRQALKQTRIQWSALSIEQLMQSKNISADVILDRLLNADSLS